MKTTIVVGGSPGIAAAIIAAKNGTDLLLIESESMVGGDNLFLSPKHTDKYNEK